MMNQTEPRILGIQLEKARNSLGLTIPEIAGQTGIDENDLIKWESEESEPSIDNLWVLAQY